MHVESYDRFIAWGLTRNSIGFIAFFCTDLDFLVCVQWWE
uniref:Uncharacterized protein n=1 Tax=Arundo donax TaxID=35708 RepID=A0A0A9AH17_ARUDO